MVEKILKEIENGEIEIEEGDGRISIYPLGLRLLAFATEQIYGFDRE
jgi:hypothetical protein